MAPVVPESDSPPCAVCGRLFSVERPDVAMWRRDPITGKRVHEECIAGIAITRGPLVPRPRSALARELPPPSHDDALTGEPN